MRLVRGSRRFGEAYAARGDGLQLDRGRVEERVRSGRGGDRGWS